MWPRKYIQLLSKLIHNQTYKENEDERNRDGIVVRITVNRNQFKHTAVPAKNYCHIAKGMQAVDTHSILPLLAEQDAFGSYSQVLSIPAPFNVLRPPPRTIPGYDYETLMYIMRRWKPGTDIFNVYVLSMTSRRLLVMSHWSLLEVYINTVQPIDNCYCATCCSVVWDTPTTFITD